MGLLLMFSNIQHLNNNDKLNNSQLKNITCLPSIDDIESLIALNENLSKKLSLIKENIRSCSQKNTIKSKQIQQHLQTSSNLNNKTYIIEAKLKNRQKQLERVSLKCHEVNKKITQEQSKSIRQNAILLQEIKWCEHYEKQIEKTNSLIKQSQKMLHNRQQVNDNLQELQLEHSQLQQHKHRLEKEQPTINFYYTQKTKQQQKLSSQFNQLKQIYNQRAAINKRNRIKLISLKNTVYSFQQRFRTEPFEKDISFVKKEHQLLIQNIIKINSQTNNLRDKTQAKRRVIAELKNKLKQKEFSPRISHSKQIQQIQQQQQECTSIKKHLHNQAQHIKSESSELSRRAQSKKHLQTFPSAGSPKQQSQIDNLISRFQQLKSKNRSRETIRQMQ